jgi:uncharacterized protein YqjF (DUF2071 family)
VAPHHVSVPVNVHRWDNISFLHWPFDPAEVARLVPDGLRVLTFDGSAWVSVTPFYIHVRPAGVPVTPPGCAFPETNVRTYVAGPDGREGVWFLHMEVTALWFVATLRAIGLPYVRQRMSVDIQRDEIKHYVSKPGPLIRGGGHDITVRPGAPLAPPEGAGLDRFLTARWGAYHRQGPALMYTPVDHPPWPLQAAEADTWHVTELFHAAGLSPPSQAPIAHFSKGVTVRVGWPRLVRN